MKIAKIKPALLYEDDALLIANKPPGVLSIPDRFAKEKPNLFTYFKEKFGKIFVVHRIDRETSGAICFAKTKEAHRHLSQQFETRTVDKYYYALLEGNVYQKEGIIDKPLRESTTTAGKMIIAKDGKNAITHYKVIEEFKHYTLVEANIKTGRMHQIRVHFGSIGYPMAIDAIYGRQAEFYLSKVKLKKYKKGKDREERPLMSRTSLHAYRLGLTHPTTSEHLEVTAELPKDFSAVLKQLRKWGS